jgi:hypothetical protein
MIVAESDSVFNLAMRLLLPNLYEKEMAVLENNRVGDHQFVSIACRIDLQKKNKLKRKEPTQSASSDVEAQVEAAESNT